MKEDATAALKTEPSLPTIDEKVQTYEDCEQDVNYEEIEMDDDWVIV